ncbi:hypothetical protein LSH36_278g00040 [Paralvinella palmiformis]|uniref:Mitochondrial 2-oxoglutarate/malate carrier protein n=1 Tax=Paralvinella palmiformis TaxID=53620 RepID=A0AAD9JIW9_9ANNE|nr:hypothetical protein LSH36_278g00040 [Paralvinella palmiformis]
MTSSGKRESIPKYIKFLFGGSAGMAATLFVQPLDLVKNRMQMSGEGGASKEHKTSLHAIRSIIRNEGFTGIYSGLSAGLLRQASYTTTRLGVYSILFDVFAVEGKPPNFATKAAIGMTAGAIGSIIGTPAEVALIRMTSDGRLPVNERRGYKNVFNALYRITTEEGVLTLWRGCGPTIARAMVVNAAQLASYSQAKQFVLGTGRVGKFLPSPLKTIGKVRIQNMRVIDGKPEYRGAFDVLVRVVSKEGFFSLWKGFTPYYARLGPHTVLTFIFLEQMNKTYRRVILHDTAAGGGGI